MQSCFIHITTKGQKYYCMLTKISQSKGETERCCYVKPDAHAFKGPQALSFRYWSGKKDSITYSAKMCFVILHPTPVSFVPQKLASAECACPWVRGSEWRRGSARLLLCIRWIKMFTHTVGRIRRTVAAGWSARTHTSPRSQTHFQECRRVNCPLNILCFCASIDCKYIVVQSMQV